MIAESRAARLTLVGLPGELRTSLLDALAGRLAEWGWHVLCGDAEAGARGGAPGAALSNWIGPDATPTSLARRLPEGAASLVPSLCRLVDLGDSYERAVVPGLAPPPDEGALLLDLADALAGTGPVLVALAENDSMRRRARRFLDAAAMRLRYAPVLLVEVTGACPSVIDRPPGACPSAISGEQIVLSPEDDAPAALAPDARASDLDASAADALQRAAALSPVFTRDLLEALELAAHWEAAGRRERSLAWRYRAGRRAEATGRVREASAIYVELIAELDTWAAGASVTIPSPRAEANLPVDLSGLLLAAARVAFEQGDLPGAGRWASRALQPGGMPRPLVAADARRLLGEAHRAAGETSLAVHHLNAGLEALGPRGDRIMRALLLGRRGWLVGYILGRLEEGRRDIDAAFELLSGLDVPAVAAQMCSHQGALEMRAGRWDRQLAANEQALRLSEQAGDTAGRIRSHINLGVCHFNQGQLALAGAQTQAAVKLALLAGADTRRVVALNNLGLVRLDEGRLEEAQAALEASLALSDGCGARGVRYETLGALARVALRRGEVARGAELASRATEEARRAGSPVAEAHAGRVLALVRLAQGQQSAALSALRGAIARAADADAYEHAVSRLVLAQICGASTEALDVELRALGADPALERARWAAEGLAPG